eukprot:12761-Heterococcus_DN1.PRE.4
MRISVDVSSRASNPPPRFDSSSTALSLSKQALYLLACGSHCRALQLANLRKCVTTAQQTDESHFRRENTTQVWPPRAKETQTTTSSGTNPPRQARAARAASMLWCKQAHAVVCQLTVQYFAGLRDDAPKEGGSVSKYIKGKTADSRARIINLTFDLRLHVNAVDSSADYHDCTVELLPCAINDIL